MARLALCLVVQELGDEGGARGLVDPGSGRRRPSPRARVAGRQGTPGIGYRARRCLPTRFIARINRCRQARRQGRALGRRVCPRYGF